MQNLKIFFFSNIRKSKFVPFAAAPLVVSRFNVNFDSEVYLILNKLLLLIITKVKKQSN